MACELPLSQLALLLELRELGLLRKDFLFSLLDARHGVSCEVTFHGEILFNQPSVVNIYASSVGARKGKREQGELPIGSNAA